MDINFKKTSEFYELLAEKDFEIFKFLQKESREGNVMKQANTWRNIFDFIGVDD